SAADAPTTGPSPATAAASNRRRRSAGGVRGLTLLLPSSTRCGLDIRNAVEQPAPVIGRRHRSRVGERRPHQATKPVGEPGDRIPGSLPIRVQSEGKPAVPGKILELHGADEYRRIEPLLRVITDVLDTGREVGVVVVALHGVADDQLAAAGDELGNKV